MLPVLPKVTGMLPDVTPGIKTGVQTGCNTGKAHGEASRVQHGEASKGELNRARGLSPPVTPACYLYAP